MNNLYLDSVIRIVYSGLRDIYRTELQQQQEFYVKDQEKWKELERCFNLKLEEKRQECEDNIVYYTAREAELEAKIDELMTRLQEQTAAYMKLQSEFDNYEWWDEAEEEEEAGKKKSRESLQHRSRPPTRPPTREEVDRCPQVEENLEEADDTEDGSIFEPALAPEPSRWGGEELVDPEVPPRRGEKFSSTEETRTSWIEEDQTKYVHSLRLFNNVAISEDCFVLIPVNCLLNSNVFYAVCIFHFELQRMEGLEGLIVLFLYLIRFIFRKRNSTSSGKSNKKSNCTQQ